MNDATKDEFMSELERELRELGLEVIPYPGAKEDAEDLWGEALTNFSNDDEVDSECIEELEEVRRIWESLGGRVPIVVRKMIHVVRMEAKHKEKGLYLTDSIIRRLLRSLEAERELPLVVAWAERRVEHYV